jgi:hypothetical protein
MISFLTRLALAPVRNRPKPPTNQQYDVALDVDYHCLLGYYLLHQLMIKDYAQIRATPPLGYTPFDITLPELLKLQAVLPCRDPDNTLNSDHAQLILNPEQYRILRKYLGKELRWLATHGTSRLKDISVYTLQMALTAVMEATLKRVTKILTWDELCKAQP